MEDQLSQRLFLIKRLKSLLNSGGSKKVAESIFTSQMWYGLQLLGKIWRKNEDVQQKDALSIERAKTIVTI